MNHIAIDIHDQYSQICVMTQEREVIVEAKIPTTPAALGDFFRHRERSRVVLEAGPHASWIAPLLEDLDHEPVVCHPRRVRLIAESRNKNDRVDAELLARMSLSDLELIKPIHPRSLSTLEQRSLLRSRAALVETQTRLRVMLRGLVKPFGVRISRGRASGLTDLAQAELPERVRISVDAVLKVLETTARQIRMLDGQIEQLNDDNPVTELLRSIPSIGMVVAIAYVLCIEDPRRFRRGEVGPYIGLAPSNRSSAGKRLSPKERGRPGDPYVRALLIQSAWTLMNSRSESDLAKWGRSLTERIGSKKAAVAVARKLAELMHHLWLHNERFIAHPGRPKAIAS